MSTDAWKQDALNLLTEWQTLANQLHVENAALRAALAEIEAYSVGWKEEVARKALDAARKGQP